MIIAVVAKLKTGSIKSVVPFGSAMPAPPYVVVKEESAMGTEVRFRVIAHMARGQQVVLDSYVKTELSALLSGFASDDRYGNYFELEDRGEWNGVVVSNDDDTISMERCFYAPLLLF